MCYGTRHQTNDGKDLGSYRKKEFFKLGQKTTVCLLTLKNGFEVVSSSACINPEDYDQEIGETISYKKAIDRVRELQGYFLHEQN